MSINEKQELLKELENLRLENRELKKKINYSRDQESIDLSIYEPIDGIFSQDEYLRYGRQMIVPEFGSLEAQTKLKQAKVLVIGAGGLGCPALLYLSACGVGTIGIVDGDRVEVSNLHRQVLHNTQTIGWFKCHSAEAYISKLNPHVKIKTYAENLTNQNAFDIFEPYDIVLDCTDKPSTRYLVNDVSVLCNMTLVSGSGLKADGQISVLNFMGTGPCYRCFYPQPPPVGSVSSCSDSGVIGPAIGLVGVSMVLEAIKVLTGYYQVDNFKPFLIMYTGYPQQSIRSFKMRRRNPNCAVCGENAVISKQGIQSGEIDYVAFCGMRNYNVLDEKFRISTQELANKISTEGPDNRVILDVRPIEQFQITHLPGSINIPWENKLSKLDSIVSYLPSTFIHGKTEVITICRYGNDSQLAANYLRESLNYDNVKDLKGGLHKWSDTIDNTIPKY